MTEPDARKLPSPPNAQAPTSPNPEPAVTGLGPNRTFTVDPGLSPIRSGEHPEGWVPTHEWARSAGPDRPGPRRQWPSYQVTPSQRAFEDPDFVEFLRSEGLENKVFTSKVAAVVNWARKFSLFQYPFVTACCGMEYMSVSGSHYDTARFGAEVPRFSPRQADLLFVVGTVTHKQAPVLRTVFEQMADPKWVIAFGVCASTGGFYDNYASVPGIDHIIPVDVYIPGCPPRPEQVIDGIMCLQEKIQQGPAMLS